MKSPLLPLLCLCWPLAALDNSFTIHNWNGTGAGANRKTTSTEQPSRPFTLFRFFAQGEIGRASCRERV